ncbi:MAG: YbaB/EbfC family nucleoid-associated protein [bacterium]
MSDFPFDLSKLDMSSLMNMAGKIQEQVKQMEESLARVEVEATVGGGMVTVKANAKGEVISVSIDPELLAMDDKNMLENLVKMGVNQALADGKARREEEMKKMTGFNLPGFFA